MFIAQELRKKSIAEYLLYMWQIEDLIRAYGCSLSRIKAEYISQFNYSDEQKEEVKKALAAGVPKATILTYFYPEVSVERMSSYRKKH